MCIKHTKAGGGRGRCKQGSTRSEQVDGRCLAELAPALQDYRECSNILGLGVGTAKARLPKIFFYEGKVKVHSRLLSFVSRRYQVCRWSRSMFVKGELF